MRNRLLVLQPATCYLLHIDKVEAAMQNDNAQFMLHEQEDCLIAVLINAYPRTATLTQHTSETASQAQTYP